MPSFTNINGLSDYFKDAIAKCSEEGYDGTMENEIFYNGEDIHDTILSIDNEPDLKKIDESLRDFLWNINFGDYLFLQPIIHTINDVLYKLQIQIGEPIYKGFWFFEEGLFLNLKGERDQEIRCMTLSLIEDILHNDLRVEAAIESDAFRHLATYVYNENVAKGIFSIIEGRINQLKGDIYYPEDVLYVDDQIDIIPGEADTLFNLNTIHYRTLFEEFEKTEDKSKGKLLENLIKVLFSSVSGLQFMRQNLRTKSSELDLLYRILASNNPFHEMFGQYLVVECKAWEKSVGVKEIRSFVGNLQSVNAQGGLLISKKGITGQENEKDILYSKLEITKAYHRHGITIALLTEEDLNQINKGENLITLLLKRYEKTRFDLSEHHS